MFEPLLEADPSFAPNWHAFQEEFAREKDLPQYLLLSDLADHLVRSLEIGKAAALPAVFAVVERWLAEGEDYVREAATVGLIEDLQNTRRYRTARPEEIRAMLGPRGRLAWADVEAFWSEGRPIPARR